MAVNTIHAVTSPNSLCSQLSGKRILLVGPETTYHLHSLLLDSREGHENRSHECVGPEFCTFHHICAPPNPPSDKFTLQNDDRYKKPPSRSELTATKSSILRYVHSTSLYASSDSKDPMYTLPQIDSDTGVRIKNAYWLTRARQADVIVLNRGPIAAPAWSYNEGGNWTFVDALYRNSSMVYLSDDTFRHSSTRAPNSRRIINAAIHTSLTVFLPAVIGTLRTLSQDQALRHKLILWHGSWFMQPTCNSVKPISSVEDLLESTANPWALYYNSQGECSALSRTFIRLSIPSIQSTSRTTCSLLSSLTTT